MQAPVIRKQAQQLRNASFLGTKEIRMREKERARERERESDREREIERKLHFSAPKKSQ